MKLVFRQYLASLRERRELDAVLPDLLSELGYTVLSRPSIGTRQYGVDIAALGPRDGAGKQRLYLFSLKQGDLTRADWDGTPQALRSSINDIIDVYIPTRIPPAHRVREIVICLCFGGQIQEAVRDNVTLFTQAQTKPGLSFEEWNGDYLAGLLVDGVLREHLLDPQLRNHFQKAVAMVDEPDVAFKHFATLIRKLCATEETTPKQRTTILRQLYICLWVLFVWARDAGNLEAPYRASERVLLQAWPLIQGDVAKSTKSSEEIGVAFADLVNLHFRIWDAIIGEKILPFVEIEHAVSVAVDSAAPADVNLKLFETLGRMAMRGLWLLWEKSGTAPLPEHRQDWNSPEATALAQQIIFLVRANPILLTPIADSQAVDIAIALLFLSMMGDWDAGARNYAEGILQRVTYAYRTHNRYPTIHGDYRSLIQHPLERTDAHRQAETKGSTLFPLLGIWVSSLGPADAASFLAQFAAEKLDHCNCQFWLPGTDSEAKFYNGDTHHGVALCNVPITEDGDDAMKVVAAETARSSPFNALSAVKLGHWPLIALACRHYRLPMPPNLWLPVVQALRARYRPAGTEAEKRLKRPSHKRSRRPPPLRRSRARRGSSTKEKP
jgi:hypothetical protein